MSVAAANDHTLSSDVPIEPPPVPETAQTVALLVAYSKQHKNESGNPDWDKVAEKMGWTREDLNAFRHANAYLISCANEMTLMVTPQVTPPTDANLVAGPSQAVLDATPSAADIANAVSIADENLSKGLVALGLTERESEQAIALQTFNKAHFAESMDMISSGVLVTSLKLQAQQRVIEDRLKVVREQIQSYSDIPSDERSEWVKEERLLIVQYTEIGKLLNSIQETWYRGAAYLAIVRSKLRGENVHQPGRTVTQRTNKPGFRPTRIFNTDGSETPDVFP